jgi:sec-independent protein translocase protein TatC
MSFVEHLTELRVRLIRILIILTVAFAVAYTQGDLIIEFLLQPLRTALDGQGKIVYLGILDKLVVQFQISAWAGVILSCPLWFREAWLFIKPGLYQKEMNIILSFIFVGFFLFVAGVIFGYYVVFPFTFDTLLSFGVTNVEANLDLKEYLILSLKVLLFLGILFQLPNVMLILGFMEMVTKQSLRKMRGVLYVIFAIFAAIITPPDMITMMIVWVPLVVLYEVGIIAVALVVHPYLKRRYA